MSRQNSKERNAGTFALLMVLALALAQGVQGQSGQLTGAIYTTNSSATAVNWNIYSTATDVYISGGPQNKNAAGLPDGTYYFQVTDPSGKTLLSTDSADCRKLDVTDGRVSGAAGACPHSVGTTNPANGVTPVQLVPYSVTPNPGGEYKAWLIPVGKATLGSDGKTLTFARSDAKTDNFKVAESVQPPVGSCQASSSLSVMALGTNVVSYVPKGNWLSGATGIGAVNVEGASIVNTLIPTSDGINSCASNSVTGVTVCTANNNKVYLLSGTSVNTTLTSSGSGAISFSGGSCTNCGVAMDAVHNKAVIGLSLTTTGGFQYLNLATNTFEPPFPTMIPGSNTIEPISEDPLIDPIRNLLLNATEKNQYELINVATTTSPSFFERAVPAAGFYGPDSSGADCTTGIILTPYEDNPGLESKVYIANLSSSSATFTAGAPGAWTAPSQVQTLTGSLLNFGANSVAVAGATHLGILSGEFGGNAITAIQLPPTLDTSSATPAITDWVNCRIPGWSQGNDPHTITAYQSPNAPNHAFALLANQGATQLARVDLTAMMDPVTTPRGANGHTCTAGTLTIGTQVTFTPVP